MAEAIEPFVYLPEYPFPICRVCKYACVAEEVLSHLTNQHGAIVSKKRAKRISRAIGAKPGVIRNQKELREWTPPPPMISRVPIITEPKEDGLACQSCQYVVREERRIKKHYRERHQWINPRKRGRCNKGAIDQEQAIPWRTGVRCQRFFPSRVASGWFEVERDGGGDQIGRIGRQEADESERRAAFLNRIQQEDEANFESEAKARIQDANDKWEAETWLSRSGWARHLDGIERDQLRAVLQPIGDNEPVLQRMWEIFERVLDEAYAAASQCYPGTAELFEIERKEAHITTDKPFQGIMEPDAWERYKAWWRTLISIWKRLESWKVHNEDGSSSEDNSDGSSDDSSEDISDEGGSSPCPRPPYRMTIRQEELWKIFDKGVTQVVTGADRNGRYTPERLQRSCLDAVVQFLDHPFKNGNHYESIIISALAVMGIDRESGGWVSVTNYTPIYSAVIKVARYLVLYQSILERHGQKMQLRQYMSAREAEEQAEGLFRIVRHKVRRFITRVPEGEDTDPTPMNWIINTRTYGMRIRFTTPGSETIDWRGDRIIHGQVRLGMGELSDMLHSLVMEARRTLVRLAIGKVEVEEGEEKRKRKMLKKETQVRVMDDDDEATLPRIPWSQIEDRHGESALEHSFIRDEDNQAWIKAGEGWVRQQIAASPARFKAWMAEPLDEQCPYKEKAVRAYGRAMEQFREQMFVLMHMLGGQPARATEILGLRMWNTANGGVRNIFIHEGMVCFVTMYHKGFRKTGNTKIIHRYLPREVGELLVWYMWLVLPFWQAVQGRMKQKWRRSAFFWADEVVSEHGGKEGKGGFSKVRAEKVEDESQEREEETAFMEWFRERKWTSDRVRRALQRYSTQFSGQRLNISAWRQIAIGISNRYFNKVFGTDDDEDEEDGGGNLVDSIHDLQAGHGSHIAGLIYARLFGQGELGTMRSREQFRKVSMQWHRFFGFGAEDRTERLGSKRVRAGFDDEREEMRRRRFGRLHRTDMRGQLKQMMGPAAEFRGLQEPVIRAVARGEWPIVQVTPTGGGKSLTFMLPAYCTPDGVTVVVTPLVALQDDMAGRCAKMGIDAYTWKSRGVQRAASLVFVTPESAVSKGFRTFVERMHGQQKLDRVVVDECHTVLGYSKTFRPQMGRLGETLQDFGVPVVCLTATLKPTQERAFFKELRFIAERVRMFREPTTRPNIQYRVNVVEDEDGSSSGQAAANTGRKRRTIKAERHIVNGEGEEEGEEDDDAVVDRVCDIVRTWTAEHEEGKVIIYGGTIKRVQGIANRLGCVAYWRGVSNAAEKARRVGEWMRSTGGEAGWIAATNALGMGIDDPNVRLVVHAGIPRALVSLVQESGRGGRDGRKSESVVVIRRSWLTQQTEAGSGQEQAGQQDEWAWDRDVIEFAGAEKDDDISRVRGEAEEEEEAAEAAIEADYQGSQRLTRQVKAERRLQAMEEAGEGRGFIRCISRHGGMSGKGNREVGEDEGRGGGDGGGDDDEEAVGGIFGMFRMWVTAGDMRAVGGSERRREVI
ncbi:hypothetical protein NCS56_00348100 [Fusarium sp. Ph1]|nr:hypothetical protein NCS56_00348100 [Fusarium sp. Ph1]